MELSGSGGAKVTVAVVNYNAGEYLEKCLRSILAEGRSVSTEIIVVDNASTDGSSNRIRSGFPDVTLIALEKNLGYGGGANEAFAVASGEVFLLLNADIELEEGCLSSLLRFMEEHPQSGIVGCRLLESDRSPQRSCRSFPSLSGYLFETTGLYRLFPKSAIFGAYHMSTMDYDMPARIDVPLGALLAVRREVWRELGGMDRRFFMYSEETDLCYRAHKRGWEIWYSPDSVAIHHGGKSTDSMPVRMFVENHRSRVLFMRIHRGRLRSYATGLILALGSLARATYWSGLLVLGGFLVKGRRRRLTQRAAPFWAVVAWRIGIKRRFLKPR